MGDPVNPNTDITLDTFAEELYARHEPLWYAEVANNYALKKFFAALGVMFQEVEDLARDQTEESSQLNPRIVPPIIHPGWSVLLDVDRVPDKGLGYLGQFVGVPLDPQLSPEKQRERIRSAEGWHRGQPASFIAAAEQYLENYSTYRKHVMLDNPIGYWRLGGREPSSGTIPDVAYATPVLTFDLLGGVIGNADPVIVDPNNHSRATAFDGNYGGNQSNTVLAFDGTKPFTIEVWIHTAATAPIGTPAGIMQRGSTTGGQQGWLLGFVEVVGDEIIRFARFRDGASSSIETSLSSDGINTPVHIVATYDGTNLRLYKNGVLVAGPTASVQSILVEGSQSAFIAANGAGTNLIISTLDELAVYDYALSPERIAAHHSAGRGTMVDPPTEGNVYLRERYLGNVAALNIVTSRLETDDATNVVTALQGIKPAGITLSHTVAPFQTFNQVRIKHASFADVAAAYANLQEMRDTIAI
jgi:hypothetical protein